MSSNDRCWTPPRAVLVIAMLSLSGCAAGTFEASTGICPPVVAYSPAEQARVAEEVATLPEGTAIVGWLADYAVLREQVRGCGRR